jgi:cytochrome c556
MHNRNATVREFERDMIPSPISDWDRYERVAERFQYKAKREDREDLRQDIILRLAQVERNKDQKHLTEGAMLRIASRTVADYWRTQFKITNGVACGSCSRKRRAQCKQDLLYGECPKAIKFESLSKPIVDSEGNLTELGELISDDRPFDLEAWATAHICLLDCPQKLLAIAEKMTYGNNLTPSDSRYLYKFRKRKQKKVSVGGRFWS